MHRLPRLMAVAAACMPLLAGCSLGRNATEAAQVKEGFTQCTPDPRILCETGSEKLALRLQPMLEDALKEVAQAQLAGFAAPVQITTYVLDRMNVNIM